LQSVRERLWFSVFLVDQLTLTGSWDAHLAEVLLFHLRTQPATRLHTLQLVSRPNTASLHSVMAVRARRPFQSTGCICSQRLPPRHILFALERALRSLQVGLVRVPIIPSWPTIRLQELQTRTL